MPSVLAEDIPRPANTAGPTIKRSSYERRTSNSTGRRNDDGKTNGVLSNGISDSMSHLTTTHRTSEDSMGYRKGNSRHSQLEDPARLAVRDDGYFADAGYVEEEEGFFSTRVKLVYNGALQEGSRSELGNQSSSRSDNGAANSSRQSEDTISREQTILNGTSVFTEPERATAADRAPEPRAADGSLRVPNQPQRTSAPPTFSNQPSQIPAPQQPPRLQHRHTLEVPRGSSSRLSRDTAGSGLDGEVISASGRFSPNPNTPTRRRASATLVRRVTRSLNSDVHLDEVSQDLEAAQYAEQVRQKRMSRRKRKEEEEEDRVLVGTKVDQHHANYVMAYNMLTGIRFTVSRTNAKMDRELTDADFDMKHKFSFDVMGAELTPSAKYDFKFKDYAPWVFRHLRSQFKIDPADYLMSLTSKYILSELGSPGKSGSFFYFSRDYRYIIKTIHHAEHKVLRKMLKEYYNHVTDNPNTLLSQFYGLHRVKIPFGRKIHFVVMNNLFPPHRDIHKTFDLKGSTIGRMFKEENLEHNPRAVMKDLNWLKQENHLELGPTKKRLFIEQMERDVKLLQRMKIMDYSLLVGIHELAKGNEEQLREKTLQVFQPGGDKEDENVIQPVLTRTPSKLETARKAKELRHTLRMEKPVPMSLQGLKMPEEIDEADAKKDHYFYQDDGGFRASHEDDAPGEVIYYLGIIDCLTHYGMIKRVEHFFKGISNVESQISPIPPERYGDRFVRFISGITKSIELARQEKADKVMSPTDLVHSTGEGHTINSLDGERGELVRSPTEKVMAKAETQAEKSRDDLNESEAKAPNRSIGTVRSPSLEQSNDGGFTLPILEEVGESSSTGRGSRGSVRSHESPMASFQRRSTSRNRTNRDRAESPASSIRSHRRYRHSQMDGTRAEMTDLERDKMLPSTPPRTPPKDSKESSLNDRPRSRSDKVDVDKALPLPPLGQIAV
ncbi:SAICAR synthase-like protein [Venturia nashicola]|uniref:1-phosphatidylinositol-4-phosphate 5-kinase n=1 Tax=Venturia nashicola TaxID=86259 RepID=A0A4Z1P2J5_9PEZI|nr:SAICAR synthase-like protein [Venturia nashicola]TLD19416.1 SAICAR synthase-like protein [Venturia nashicola]